MRSRIDAYLAGLCTVLLVLFVVVVANGRDADTATAVAADGSQQTSDQTSSESTSSTSADASGKAGTSEKDDKPAGPNFKIAPLKPGEQPPQFIIFSFDGAGSTTKWATFSAAAKKVDAQFVGFLTGTYLLPDDAKTAYQGPGHSPGKSSVGFGGTPAEVAKMVTTLNGAKAAGHEIGTHYNGHFCAGAEPSGKDWSTEQWNSELDQFFNFLANYQSIGSLPGPALEVTAEDIKGGRTPCLEGKSEVFFPASAAHGMTYDTSLVSSGMVWPKPIDGLWEFHMPSVRVPATDRTVIAMDYNFWYQFNKATDAPGQASQFTTMVLDTYHSMLQAAMAGNRAPLVIGNHFNDWSGNAFNPAVEQFMLEACDQDGVVCTTYQNVMKWMGAQTGEVLQALVDLPATYN